MSQRDDTYLKQLQARYRKASKKEKTVILDEYVKTTGYHRKQAIAVLNRQRERVRGPIQRPRRAQYGVEEANAIAALADLFDNICSKRLRAAMDVELPRLYQAGVLRISSTCCSIPATARVSSSPAYTTRAMPRVWAYVRGHQCAGYV